jgi:methylamine dehydrogenase light chain
MLNSHAKDPTVSKSSFDKLGERMTRRLASYSSRRGFLCRLGMALVAAPALPLLPVSRAAEPAAKTDLTDFERNAQSKDQSSCNYWRYCAIDGVLCGCCGGGVHTCPAGSEPSPISWIGTCRNPDDGRSYVIAYRDCCGKPICTADSSCLCVGQDHALPTYRAQLNNDILWCFGNSSATYHCSTAALIGLAG